MNEIKENEEEEYTIKIYKYWSGFNDFYCKGRVMVGPGGLKNIILTTLLIDTSVVVIFIFIIFVSNDNVLIIN